jgi:anaerobic ribonucleoside-triphosphate reductase activating protein
MRYASVLDMDLNNGEGVRVSLWVSGCPHECVGCHNEDLWDKDTGITFSTWTLSNLIELLDRDISKNLSILGGEPLAPYNVEDVTEICRIIKFYHPNKNIWLWTGYNWDEVKELPIMKYLDVVVDGKFEIELADPTLLFKGSSNQRVIDVKTGEEIKELEEKV